MQKWPRNLGIVAANGYTLCNMVTDYDIQALIDNQLGWEEEKYVRSSVDADPALRRRYDEIMAQKKLLQQWWSQDIELDEPESMADPAFTKA